MPDDLPPRREPARPPPTRHRPVVSSGVLGMLVFVAVEAMFFAGLLSAYLVMRAAVPPGAWPPPHQPRLPIEETAINTAALLLSGVLLWVAALRFRRAVEQARLPLLSAALLGAFFVVFQGVEWAALIKEGLTLQSSTHGAFFYLIVGAHAAHAVGALVALAWAWRRGAALKASELHTVLVLWTFVVGMWPLIYGLVYLG